MANLTTIARPYAKAVLDLARTTNSYAQWSNMLDFLAQVITDPQVNVLVRNQALAADQKAQFLNSMQAGYLTPQAQNLIKLLAYYKRLLILPEIYTLYEALRQIEQQQVAVQLILAREISTPEFEQLSQAFAAKIAGQVTVEQESDPALLAGGRLKIGDRVIEASVRDRLTALYSHLTH